MCEELPNLGLPNEGASKTDFSPSETPAEILERLRRQQLSGITDDPAGSGKLVTVRDAAYLSLPEIG